MDQEDYEDYLVDKAKELLKEDLTDAGKGDMEKPEMRSKTSEIDEKAEKDSTSEIPAPWDPREVEHLARNRKKMSKEEMEEFLKKDSELHREIEELDEWSGFSRWEERFIIQRNGDKPGDIAEELERDVDEVRIKMRIMGLVPEKDDEGRHP